MRHNREFVSILDFDKSLMKEFDNIDDDDVFALRYVECNIRLQKK